MTAWHVLCKALAPGLHVTGLSQALSVDLSYMFLNHGKVKESKGENRSARMLLWYKDALHCVVNMLESRPGLSCNLKYS